LLFIIYFYCHKFIEGGGIFQANDILADPNATIRELDQPIIFKDGVFTMESKEGMTNIKVSYIYSIVIHM
jgi:hypothetical protein